MEVAVSILNEKYNYEEAIQKVNDSKANLLHLDIMDNTFTSTFSFDYEEAKKICELSNKKIDIHIMSTDLDNILSDYIKLKPHMISIHYEAVENIDKYIEKIKKHNIKTSIAINPDTNVSEIYQYLENIDNVLVMSVYPGKGGQTFIEGTTFKLKELYKMKKEYSYTIEVDGGINDTTINKVNKYTDIVVSGSYITNSDDYDKQIKNLNK